MTERGAKPKMRIEQESIARTIGSNEKDLGELSTNGKDEVATVQHSVCHKGEEGNQSTAVALSGNTAA